MDADVIVVGAGLSGLVATAELADAGRRVRAPRPGERRPTSAARRTGRSAGSSSSTAPSSAGWASRTPSTSPGRTGRARPASTGSTTRTSWPGQWAPGLRRLRRRREAGVAARAGRAVLPRRRLGRARRRPRLGSRQLGAALPHHLGHRPRRARAVPAPGRRARRGGTGRATAPPPGRRARHVRRRGHRRARRGARRRHRRGAAGRPTATSSATSSYRAGRHRHQGWHRRQPRPRPRQLA